MYGSLREYIDRLEREGELVRVKTFVNPVEEMAEIADRVVKHGGKALLFENTGTPFPVAMNLFGSDRRMALALGAASLDELPLRIGRLAEAAMSPKGSLAEKIGTLPLLGEAARWFPKRLRGRGACQQVVRTGDDASLDILPVLKCWPADGGRFVTLPMVHTVDPVTGAGNVGMYRMQVFDDRTTGMHWHMHKTGAKHYEAYRRAGRRMPVSVCLGGDPAYAYAATAPLPDGIDEYLLAGFLRGRPVRLVRCVTNDLYVPADCDFVIEGYVDPAEEKVVEGPFGDHTGFYSLEDRYPRFHVTAVTHRRDAVWPATVVGVPVQEDYFIAKATERIFLAPIRLALQPDLEGLHMPASGVAHNLAIVSQRVRYPGHVRQTVSSLWGAGQMMFNKYMLVVSAGTDVRDGRALARLLRAAEPERAAIRGARRARSCRGRNGLRRQAGARFDRSSGGGGSSVGRAGTDRAGGRHRGVEHGVLSGVGRRGALRPARSGGGCRGVRADELSAGPHRRALRYGRAGVGRRRSAVAGDGRYRRRARYSLLRRYAAGRCTHETAGPGRVSRPVSQSDGRLQGHSDARGCTLGGVWHR